MIGPDPSRRTFLARTGLAGAVLLLGPGRALAEIPMPGVDGVSVSVQLRAEYVRGVPMLVPVIVSNRSDGPVRVPDLAARPWLIRFEFVLPDGRKLRYATTPPGDDDQRMVSLPRRGQRRTLLEIPGARAMPAGRYELAVQILDSEDAVEIARQPVTVADPRVVGGDLGPGSLAGSKAGLQAVWLHRTSEGLDVYLHRASTEHPARVIEQRWLAHVDDEIAPLLAAARATDATSPGLAWREGRRRLHLLRVDPAGSVLLDHSVEAPWPDIDLAGRPALARGALHVPVWVPAPGGRGGELRVAASDGRGRPSFPLMARFDGRPVAVRTAVSSAGAEMFLVQHAGGIDLYTGAIGPAAAGGALVGRRLWVADDGAAPLHASFQILRDTDAVPGGLGVLLLLPSAKGLGGRWLDLQGNERLTLPLTTDLPAGALVSVLGRGPGYPALLFRGDGQLHYVEGPARQTLPAAAGPLCLVAAAEGRVVLRQLGRKVPVSVTTLSPKAR